MSLNIYTYMHAYTNLYIYIHYILSMYLYILSMYIIQYFSHRLKRMKRMLVFPNYNQMFIMFQHVCFYCLLYFFNLLLFFVVFFYLFILRKGAKKNLKNKQILENKNNKIRCLKKLKNKKS